MQTLLKGIVPLGFLGLCVGIASFMMMTKPEPSRRIPPEETLTVQAMRLMRQEYQVVVPSQGIVQAKTRTTVIPRVSGEVIWVSESFRSGGYFKEGESLVQIDPSDYETALSSAEARLLASQASLELARLTHERNQEIIEEKLIPRAELDLSAANLKVAESDVQSAQASLDRAKRDLDRTWIKAPFEGRVLSQNVDIGQNVSPGIELADIFATDYAEIRLPLRNDHLDYISLPEAPDSGSVMNPSFFPEVRLTGKVGTQSTDWIGRVVRTQSAYDAKSRELFVIAQIDSPFAQTKQSDLPLKLNQYVNAEIQGDRLKEVYVIPRSALRNNSEVIIINEEGTIARRSVKVVWKQGEDIVISEGISDRELLCLTPILFASEGIRVKPLIEGESLPTLEESPDRPREPKAGKGNSSGSEPKTKDS